jgi:plastocyanin
MKNTFALIALTVQSLFVTNTAHATVHIISASGTTIPTDVFTPRNVNAVVGDTIKWVWVSGVHTTESVDVPAGAAAWYADLTASDTVFTYVLTVPGSYYYDCHYLTIGGHGMDGDIEVAPLTTGIFDNKKNDALQVYPNPFSDKIVVKDADAEIVSVYNIAGQKIKTFSLNNGQSDAAIDMADVTKGIYYYQIIKAGLVVAAGKLMKN